LELDVGNAWTWFSIYSLVGLFIKRIKYYIGMLNRFENLGCIGTFGSYLCLESLKYGFSHRILGRMRAAFLKYVDYTCFPLGGFNLYLLGCW